MAIPVARVYLGMEHAALPALLPTPPMCKMLPLLSTPPCLAAAIVPKPAAKRSSLADSDERWDAHKARPASPALSPSSSSPRSADSSASSLSGARGSSRKNSTSPLKPGRADSAERWDAHKKDASSPASSPSSSSSSGTSSLLSSTCLISRASSAERWDVHKKRRSSQTKPLRLEDGDSSSTGSNDIDDDEMEEEIVYRPPPPRAMYAGPGFAAASPEPSMLPVPTAFLASVA